MLMVKTAFATYLLRNIAKIRIWLDECEVNKMQSFGDRKHSLESWSCLLGTRPRLSALLVVI